MPDEPDNAPVRASSKDNELNGNVHPNSRAARGDEAIEAERAAREAAQPSSPAPETAVDNSAELEDLNSQVDDLTADNEALATQTEELTKANADLTEQLEKAQSGEATAHQDEVKAVERAEKAEARVTELEKQLEDIAGAKADDEAAAKAKTDGKPAGAPPVTQQ